MMYYLYYNREKVILTKDRIQDGRHEMLEQNPVVEKLVQRSKVYTQSYRCEFEIVDKDTLFSVLYTCPTKSKNLLMLPSFSLVLGSLPI